MKKIILTVAAVMALSTAAKAQDTNSGNVKLGIKAGLNVATVTGDVPDDVESRAGFHAGIVAEFKVAPNFSIQPELLYSQQGFKYDLAEDGFIVATTLKLDYLNLPVLAKYYVIEGFSIEAGPQFGYRLSSKLKYEASGIGNYEADFEDETNEVDFSLVGGLAYDLPIGLFFQARYTAGLSKINNDNDGSTKNGVFQASVGYKF